MQCSLFDSIIHFWSILTRENSINMISCITSRATEAARAEESRGTEKKPEEPRLEAPRAEPEAGEDEARRSVQNKYVSPLLINFLI